jgi:antitoxin component YwqK of YwqJK toxin-antitoxin module
MRTSLLFYMILFIACASHGQDTVNVTDSGGKKQGYWYKKDQNGKKIYEGRFQDNLPVGEFKYYYPDGAIKAVSILSKQGTCARTVIYFQNGKKNAEGFYLHEKRDSTWKFFSEVDATLVSEEFYKDSKKQGKAFNYYPGGGKAELTTWKNGVREGPWETYFTDGKTKLKCGYKNDQKNGPIQVFFFSGKAMLSGQYLNGNPVGTWVYYKEQGGIIKKEQYDNGRLIKVDSTMGSK